MSENGAQAPGQPGITPRWTSSAKSGVGTSLHLTSRVWFTLSHGILNEIYYPRVDQACTRDLGLIVTDGQSFFSEEKRHASHQVSYVAPGCPAYRLVNTCDQGRYRIEKEVLADPEHDVILQRVQFKATRGKRQDYHLYVILAPHLGNQGAENTAWLDDYKGVPMLLAARESNALALACSLPFVQRSVGFVGASDGWQDLEQHKEMTWFYDRAENGNVALTGEVDLRGADEPFVLALGFGMNGAEAGNRALSALQNGFDAALATYQHEWREWQDSLRPLDKRGEPAKLYRASTAMLRVHEAKRFRGGVIASLSIPWGSDRGDSDLGGYHLAWPRDLVEVAGGLLAAGAGRDACRIMQYLQSTQEEDGHWPQNMWLDGTPYWQGIQMDETAFPILLINLARREKVLQDGELDRYWPMVRRAAGFLVRNGPVTQQDRWEEDPGYSPFTLAVEVAALLAAAAIADVQGEHQIADYLRETADAWNESIERWTYVTDTDLARQVGVEGYYVRIAPVDAAEGSTPDQGFVPIKNRPPGQGEAPATNIVSPDAFALVRFGLRAATDPRIANTVKAVDALLKVDTPYGPAWHRYDGDGYGEHEDGSAFDGTGVGRAWPLLTGERAHLELAAGRPDEAKRLLGVMEAFANEAGLISEQVWDTEDIPEQDLTCGRPSGSAMPLAWAHAEYVKLCRSLNDGRVFDMPPEPAERYQKQGAHSQYAIWRSNNKSRAIPAGKTLRLEILRPAVVHWSLDDWKSANDTKTRDTGLGIHLVDLPTDTLPDGATARFTLYWPEEGRWEGADYAVGIEKG